MFDLMMPKNAKEFFKVLVTIAVFDVIPTNGLMDWAGNHIRASKVKNETPENFVDFEFEDSDPIQNMRAFFLFIIILLVLPVILKIVSWILTRS